MSVLREEPGSDELTRREEALSHQADVILEGLSQELPATARRPYTKPISGSWFLRTREYRAYALREFSSVVVGFFVFDLAVGVVAINRGLAGWTWWVDLQRNPVLLVLTGFAFLMAVVHATTWFRLTPKVIRVRRGQRYIPDKWLVLQNYLALAAFAVLLVWWLGGFR